MVVLAAAFATFMCGGNDDPAPSETKNVQTSGPACEQDSQCEFPLSQCEGSGTLIYFTNPRCVLGRCVAERQTRSCPCSNGGCNITTTTGAVAGFGGNSGTGGSGGGAGVGASGGATDGGGASDATAPACTEQDLSRCALPRSECIDGHTMRYFTDPSCVEGHCTWKQSAYNCVCIGGACQSTTTAGGTGP